MGSASRNEDMYEPIAIIGLACRYGGDVKNSSELLRHVMKAKSVYGAVPEGRLDARHLYHPATGHIGSIYSNGGYFLKDDINNFDSAFFQLPENDVVAMDPQQKMLLESVYHALENAGMSMKEIASTTTSVYVGCSNNDSLAIANSDLLSTLQSGSMTSVEPVKPSILPAQAAWLPFIKHARAYSMDTPCLGVLSPDGQCFTFDERANGYGRGEGVGTVILKPLRAALRDGNHVRAVVRSTGSNQDGRTAGITLPNAVAQEQLIRSVYAAANLSMADTGYVEAHGTGTFVGDPLELTAISSAFAPNRESDLFVSSVKSVIGHLEGGAGIAGLISATLAVESGSIPPVTNLQKLNPNIPNQKRIRFTKEAIPWPRGDLRRASVNSFGFGGTNAHVVLEDIGGFLSQNEGFASASLNTMKPFTNGHAHTNGLNHQDSDLESSVNGLTHKPNGAVISSPAKKRILTLSAFDEDGIQRNNARLVEYLQSVPVEGQFLENFLHTVNEKRSSFDWRCSYILDSHGSLLSSLRQVPRPLRVSKTPKIVRFVFTGQGANWPGMAQDLMVYRIFETRICEAAKYFMDLGADWDLREILARSDWDMTEPTLAQSTCIAVQVGLVDLLMSWNIVPTTVVGHSSGEIAAAYCAGKISRQAAWKVAFCRGVVCSKAMGNGTMMAAAVGEKQAEELLSRLGGIEQPLQVQIGCFNSPKNLTFTGKRESLDRLKQELEQSGIFCKLLGVKVAYHSAELKAVAGEYLTSLGDLNFGDRVNQNTGIRMHSSLTGECIGPHDDIGPEYWVKNLVSPVRFTSALLDSIGADSDLKRLDKVTDTIIEIGPHSALRSAIQDTFADSQILQSIGYASILKRGETSGETVLQTMGLLYTLGYPVDITAVNEREMANGFNTKHVLNDLPPYAFRHTSKRATTRQIEALKFPAFGRHELLGVPLLDSNPFEQRWRNFIGPQQVPWLSSNRLNDKILFPGVAYILMAVEAALLRFGALDAGAVELRNISILESLFVPDDEVGVEIIFSLSQLHEATELSGGWSRFRFVSHNLDGNSWTEHCVGSIRVEKGTASPPRQLFSAAMRAATASTEAENRYFTEMIEPDKLYESFSSAGTDFGDYLKGISEFRRSQDRMAYMSHVLSPDIPRTAHDRYTIHPCALESILQGLLCLGSPEGTIVNGSMVANRLGHVWITNPLSDETATSRQFKTFAETERKTSTIYTSDVAIYAQGSLEPNFLIKGLDLVLLPPQEDGQAADESFYVETWKPDAKMLTSFEKVSGSQELSGSLIKAFTREDHQGLQLTCSVFVLDSLQKISGLNEDDLPLHLRSFVDWIKAQAEIITQGRAPFVDLAALEQVRVNDELKQALFDSVARRSARGELLTRVGVNLVPILTQQVDSLELMFGSDDIMSRTYNEGLPGDVAVRISHYLEYLSHNQSRIRILEVGAGTGSATKIVLDAFRNSGAQDAESGILPIDTYDFTDMSGAFFERAKSRFADWSDVLRYQTFDVEKDPALQGFELASYDLVIATHVLHATANLQVSLKNIKSLLKSGGDLIVIENVKPQLMCTPLAFGILPGWWRGIESYRQSSPLIDQKQWDAELEQAGFKLRMQIQDTDEAANHETSATIASTQQCLDETCQRRYKCAIIYHADYVSQLQLARECASTLAKVLECDCSLVSLREADAGELDADFCVSLLNLQGFDLSDITDPDFQQIKLVLETCINMIWVSGNPDDDSKAAMCRGLVRSARWERDQDAVNFITLGICNPLPPNSVISEQVARVARGAFISQGVIAANGEYATKDGVLLTNRLLPAKKINKAVNRRSEPKTESIQLGAISQGIKLTSIDPHKPQAVHFIRDELAESPLGHDEVQLKVHAAGVRREDADEASRLIPGQGIGRDCVGLVTEIGSSVTDVAVGDRVMAVRTIPSSGALSSLFRTHCSAVQKIPDGVGYLEAATIPWNFCTAHYCIVKVARVQPGETIMIQCADNAIGQAAIQLAKSIGANLLCTVSSSEDNLVLASRYNLDQAAVLSNDKVPLGVEAILSSIWKGGINVYLNCDPMGISDAYQSHVTPFGRVVDLHGAATANHLALKDLSKASISYTSVDMDPVAQSRPELIQEALLDTSRRLSCSQFKPLSHVEVLGYSELPKAILRFRDRQSKNPSMFVVQPKDDEVVPMRLEPIGDYRLRGDASYLLVGGFGGIGRRLALWMHSRGARNFIFLSRSGPTDPRARELCETLKSSGCRVESIVSDAADTESVNKSMQRCRDTMPPIKGCVQCSMVLVDSMICNMSHSQFMAAIRPKVQGTINIANNLPKKLDFFILLSSSSAIIGNRGQANYAAANVFLDTFARHLTAQGRPTTSISLGSVLSFGWVAENQDRLPIALAYGTITEDRLLSILEYHMDPRLGAAENSDNCHTIAGLRSASDFQRHSVPLPAFMSHPLFTHLRASGRQGKANEAEATISIAQGLAGAASTEEAVDFVSDAIIAKISRIMAISPKDMETYRTLSSYGVDSLVTVDMKSWFKRELGATVGTKDILGELTIYGLAEKVVTGSSLRKESVI
ncbi:Polyketide synthase [Metarhizium humberi]|uniref:Polyketide synthase n=1 Tax=Metarhizium humberi TaxID=2596975 RepID=A0A9P8M3P5_9HYPO|nr:Polyketide synthase [Metarhizium humberi]